MMLSQPLPLGAEVAARVRWVYFEWNEWSMINCQPEWRWMMITYIVDHGNPYSKNPLCEISVAQNRWRQCRGAWLSVLRSFRLSRTCISERKSEKFQGSANRTQRKPSVGEGSVARAFTDLVGEAGSLITLFSRAWEMDLFYSIRYSGSRVIDNLSQSLLRLD